VKEEDKNKDNQKMEMLANLLHRDQGKKFKRLAFFEKGEQYKSVDFRILTSKRYNFCFLG
jgi:hypothetical protein